MKLLQNDPKQGIGCVGGRVKHHPFYRLKFPLVGQDNTVDIPMGGDGNPIHRTRTRTGNNINRGKQCDI